MCYSAKRKLDDGREYDRISSWIMPNIMSVPNPIDITQMRSNMITWSLPVDDSHFTMATASRLPKGVPDFFSGGNGFRMNGKLGAKCRWTSIRTPPATTKPRPGPISLHSEEHLASSDGGIIMQRRMLKAQIRVVAEGGDPVGVTFDSAPPLVTRAPAISITLLSGRKGDAVAFVAATFRWAVFSYWFFG